LGVPEFDVFFHVFSKLPLPGLRRGWRRWKKKLDSGEGDDSQSRLQQVSRCCGGTSKPEMLGAM